MTLSSRTENPLRIVQFRGGDVDREGKSEDGGDAGGATATGRSNDPIRWFGILVPTALRSSQAAFKSVVLDCVTQIVRVDQDMKALEIEIRRTRKKLEKSKRSI